MPRIIAGWLILVVSAVGCGFSASREAAAESMARYFEAVEHRDYNAALAVCADSFFQETSREAREAELAANARRLGDLLSYEAVSWNVKKNVGAGAGTYVKVVYKTRYSRQPAVERFILKKVDRQFAIIAHQIEARGLPRGKTHFI